MGRGMNGSIGFVRSGTSDIPLTGVCYSDDKQMRSSMNDNYSKRAALRAALLAGLVLWPLCTLAADTHTTPPPAVVKQFIDEDLVGADRKELLMFTVEYLPGGASLPPPHHAPGFP